MVVEVMNVYVALDLLAKAVREAREERGLSQRELARKLSMNTRTIMDLEICRSNPKGETIFLIARELHISLGAIAHAGPLVRIQSAPMYWSSSLEKTMLNQGTTSTSVVR